MTQGDLLAGLPVAPAEDRASAIARARTFVDQVKTRRVCARCCSQAQLQFVARQAGLKVRVPIWRLVMLGASAVRIREAIAGCDVLCRRCELAGVNPQMLRGRRPLTDHVGAKGRIRAAA